MSTINLYVMPNCGFCTKAKAKFKKEIANGEISLKPHTQAPKGVRGFPHFECNGKSHSGLPSSLKALRESLGLSREGYQNFYRGIERFQEGRWPAQIFDRTGSVNPYVYAHETLNPVRNSHKDLWKPYIGVL